MHGDLSDVVDKVNKLRVRSLRSRLRVDNLKVKVDLIKEIFKKAIDQ